MPTDDQLIQRDLKTKFTAKLQSSGLSLNDAKKLKFEMLNRDQIGKLGLPEFEGFTIPYFTAAGDITEFYRVRYLESTKTGFAKLSDAKELRYIQPKGTVNEVYMPPLLDWEKILDDAEVPIVITEGELKAATACKHDLPTVGLGGVWTFKSGPNGLPLLPWFESVKWAKRVVYIAYDSDATSNHKVLAAENALARELMNLGAMPHIVRLPAVNGKKAGMDDFIVNRGIKAFTELLDKAQPFKAAELLHELNEKVVYVRDPGVVLRLRNNQRMRPGDFYSHSQYAKLKYTETVETEKSTKKIVKFAAKEWVTWDSRGEVEKVVYSPGKPQIYDNCLNVWAGWGVEPVEGDIKPWIELMAYIFGGDNAEKKWFEAWCAYPLQHPGCKLYTSSVLWGLRHGTGKTLIGETLSRIYGRNATQIEDADLHASHNEWAENKQFVMGDDITGSDKQALADRLKTMITRTKLRLNPKYVPSYEVIDCINYYFTSNNPDAFKIDQHDRRYFVYEVRREPMCTEFYQDYDAWMRGDGPKHLFHYLLNLNVKFFNPKAHAMETQSKREMIDQSMSDLGRWMNQLRIDPDGVLKTVNGAQPYKLWTNDQILKMYDPGGVTKVTSTGIARELKRQGFNKAAEGQSCRTEGGQVALWVLRDAEAFKGMSANQSGRYYDEERKVQKPKKERKF